MKNNKKEIILFLFVVIIFNLVIIDLPYTVYSPGSIINVDKRLTNVKDDSKGSFNITFVTSRNGSLFNLLLAKIIPDWDIYDNSDLILDGEDIKDMDERDKISIKEGISNASYVAYTNAGYDVNIVGGHNYVYYIDEEAISELKVGDEIVKCDDGDVNSLSELNECISKHNIDEEVDLDVIRDGKNLSTKSKLYEYENRNIIGIVVTRINDYKNNPDISFNAKRNESGSSGGLMMSLAIYDALVDEDITNGLKIAGTGTINYDGSVGEIGGVKYKIIGAVHRGCKVFIVPDKNYDEALKVVNEKKFNIKLIRAYDFKQVLGELKNLKN